MSHGDSLAKIYLKNTISVNEFITTRKLGSWAFYSYKSWYGLFVLVLICICRLLVKGVYQNPRDEG